MSKFFTNLMANVKKEGLLSFSNVFVMIVTFMVLGIFVSIIVFSQTVIRHLENQAQVTVFFKDDFPEAKILEMKTQLEQDGRIAMVNYISKDDAFKIFAELNKEDPILLESVTSNILPASLEVRSHDIADLKALTEELNQKDGVEEVRFFEDIIARFKTFSTIVYVVGFVLVLIFFIISYSIVIATLRATINSKGTELEIMKLVGATDPYVRNPLIHQGTFYGIVSSFFAGILLFVVLMILDALNYIPDTLYLGFLSSMSFTPLVFGFVLLALLMLSGALLGYFGSSTAVKKYLKY